MKQTAQLTVLRQPARPGVAWRSWLAGACLVLSVAAVYWPTLANGFVWDDDTNVEKNVPLRSVDGLLDIWFQPGSVPQYYPLVQSSFWVEYQLWALDPLGYHVVNMLLHAVATVLTWRLLVRLQVPGAWLAAAIFAVHPVEVESVAWVTERKNVLSCALALAALLAYLRFSPAEEDREDKDEGRRMKDENGPESNPSSFILHPSSFLSSGLQPPASGVSKSGDVRFYMLSFGLYVAALLAKTVTASVPAVLLVIYWWKRGRLTRRDVSRLVPFFAVGVALAMVTILVEDRFIGAKGEEWDLGAVDRVLLAGRVVWFYVGKLVWPEPLIFIYPRWTIDAHDWPQYLAPAAAVAVLAVLWLARKRIGRGPLAAVLVFGGVLVPALGFFNVYFFRFSYVADHFQYHASIALVAAAAAGGAIAFSRLPQWASWTAAPWAACLLVALGLIAHERTYPYKDQPTLYGETIEQNPTSWLAYNNLGDYLQMQGKSEEAAAYFRRAIALRPNDAKILFNYATALSVTGNLDQAVSIMRESIRLDPKDGAAEHSLGTMYDNLHAPELAIDHLKKAVYLEPSNDTWRVDLAIALIKANDKTLAESHLRRAIEINPVNADAHNHLGSVFARRGDIDRAIEEFTSALAIDPTHAIAQKSLQMVRDAKQRQKKP